MACGTNDMDVYPKKTCGIDRLIRSTKLVQAALGGRKTQQRRDGVYAYPGEEFELEGVRFRVTGLVRESLADMTDASARAEGFDDLNAYKNLILKMHANMVWDTSALVWVHSFERI